MLQAFKEEQCGTVKINISLFHKFIIYSRYSKSKHINLKKFCFYKKRFFLNLYKYICIIIICYLNIIYSLEALIYQNTDIVLYDG